MKKVIITTVLIGIALIAFYYSLFWGWASGAGSPPNSKELKNASDLAFGASGLLVMTAISIWIFPVLKAKKQK